MSARLIERRPITPDEAAEILWRHRAGQALLDIADHLRRATPTVRQYLKLALAVGVNGAHGKSRRAPGTREAEPQLRPTHVTAQPGTREWFAQCGEAFAVAMAREHPEIARCSLE